MSNTLIIDSLNTLFSMSNTAVIGAQEQFVAFMNPAAQELFRGNRTNHKLTELLPALIPGKKLIVLTGNTAQVLTPPETASSAS